MDVVKLPINVDQYSGDGEGLGLYSPDIQNHKGSEGSLATAK
jgi:hypothetical protein